MKVTQIHSLPIRDDSGRVYFFVSVDTDAGIYGLGEVGTSWYGPCQSWRRLNTSQKVVIGSDPWETERLWQLMFRGNFFPADRTYGCAISAIDIALWDIKGKAVDMPVYKLMGGPTRDKVVCYAHTHKATRSKPSWITVSNAWMMDGNSFDGINLKPPTPTKSKIPDASNQFESIRIAVGQMARVREAVGHDIQLCFDVHTRLDPTHVIQMCRDLEEFKPYFIEDPDPLRKPEFVPQPASANQLSLSPQESNGSPKWPFRQVIEEELIDYARIDLCIVGRFD